eukprot:4585192-Pyramimonas_sp.AAC.1
MRCVWGSLEEECSSDPAIWETLRAAPDQREQGVLDAPIYQSRPEVAEAREHGRPPPPPLAVYLDG